MKKIALLFFLIPILAFGQNKNIDSLKIVLFTAKESNKIKVLIDLCWEYRFINADSARVYGLRALNLAQEAKLEDYEGDALHNIGVTLEAQGNYTEALAYEIKALAIRQKIGDQIKTAATLNNLGIIHDEQGNYQKALDYYFQARRIYEALGNDSKVAMVLVNIGIVLRAQKEYDKVLTNYYQAIAIYKKLNNQFALAACHANLGSVFLEVPNYDSSLHYSLLATREFEVQNIRQFLPTTIGNIGTVYDSLGNTQLAKEYLLKAKALHEEYDNKKELATVLIQLATIYQKTGELKDAELFAQKALVMAEKIGALEQITEAHKSLSALYANEKNYKLAYQEHRRYVKSKDSLFQQKKTEQMAELLTQYETEKKEQENDIQRLVISEQKLTLQRNQTFIVGLVALLALLAFIGVLWRSQIKWKQQKDMEQQQLKHREELTKSVIELQERERSRFAQDLHDGFGQMITALKFQLESPNQIIENTSQLIGQMHDEIRNVSFALSPQVLIRDGLVPALKELALRINMSGKANLTVQSTGVENRVPPNFEITIYRICQEWINNVLKYSGANKITLQLVKHAEELILTIEDNGNSFDAAVLEKGSGNGWKNIQSRARVLDGQIDIDAQAGRKGTTFILSIPKVQ